MLDKLIRKMKKNKYYILLLLFVVGLTVGFNKNTKSDEDDKERVLMGVLEYILQNGHYSPVKINDDFSEHIYMNFIDEMDPSKRYFTQSDIDEFSVYEFVIDDQFKSQDLSFFNYVYTRFLERKAESVDIYREILSQPFNYQKEESLDIEYKNAAFAKNENELADLWRKQLKLTTVSRLYDKMEVEEDKFKADSTYTKKSFESKQNLVHFRVSKMAFMM